MRHNWANWSMVAILCASTLVACGSDTQGDASDEASGGSGVGGLGAGASGGTSTSALADLSQALTLSTTEETTWPATFVDATSPYSRTIEVTNTADIMVAIEAALVGDGASAFAFERALQSENLPSGDTDWLSVVFAPTESGDMTAELVLTVSDPDDPSNTEEFTVDLTASALPWSYLGSRGLSEGSAGSFLKASDPVNPERTGRSDDRSMAIAVDESGVYLAYKDNTQLFDATDTESGRLTVMKYESGVWATLGSPGFSEGDVMWLSMVVHQGTPYVAYTDGLDPEAPEEGKATVMRFDGVDWVPVGAAQFTLASAAYNSLAIIDNQGSPELYLSFQDGAQHLEIDGNDRHCTVSVMRFSGTAWEYLGQPTFSYPELSGSSTSVAVTDSAVFVAYASGLYRYDSSGGTWTKMASFAAGSTALAVDDAGELYVALTELAQSGKVSVYHLAADGLEVVGNQGISAGPADFLSLGIRDQNLVASFTDFGTYGEQSGVAVVAELVDGTWTVTGGAPASEGEANHVCMATSAGQLYLGFKDETMRASQTMEGSGKASAITLR